MKKQLAPVIAELRLWRDQGLSLPLWWRDDDATAPSPALDRLLDLAEGFVAPLHLAVVPHSAQETLSQCLREAERVFAMPHGWRHQNHARTAEKKAEFGAHRPLEVMLEDAARGRVRIKALFGPLALPVFTPPWNRVCPAVVAGLADCGFRAISRFRPRGEKYAAPGLLQVNCHLDPIAWHGAGGLSDVTRIAALIVAQLTDRRLAHADNTEPYGLLTHHLVHDEPLWTFTESLIEVFLQSGVAEWVAPLREAKAR